MKTLFVDTSAWCALFNRKDHFHQNALEAWSKIIKNRIFLISSDYIFDELMTLLSKKTYHHLAVKQGRNLLASQILNFMTIDQNLFNQAWDFFQKFNDQNISFTDCTSFVLMQANKVTHAWSYDLDFQLAGFMKF